MQSNKNVIEYVRRNNEVGENDKVYRLIVKVHTTEAAKNLGNNFTCHIFPIYIGRDISFAEKKLVENMDDCEILGVKEYDNIYPHVSYDRGNLNGDQYQYWSLTSIMEVDWKTVKYAEAPIGSYVLYGFSNCKTIRIVKKHTRGKSFDIDPFYFTKERPVEEISEPHMAIFKHV